jgi:HSP20 family protein
MRGGSFGGIGGGPFGLGSNSFDPATLATQLWNQFTDTHPSNNSANSANPTESADHTPDADIFDTESSYVVHLSLPGAKKEDVGVNWDNEKSELSVAGVIYRPGDENFLKTLAMNERKVGPFERKIRLGTRASPAHIDADGITAKLEDGVLRVDVPKLDSGYVEIRKVDVE